MQRGKAAALGHCPGQRLSGRRRRSGRLSLRYNEWRGHQQLVHTLCKMRPRFTAPCSSCGQPQSSHIISKCMPICRVSVHLSCPSVVQVLGFRGSPAENAGLGSSGDGARDAAARGGSTSSLTLARAACRITHVKKWLSVGS